MKLKLTLAALAATALSANAAIIASTGFESAEDAGFTNNVNNNFSVTTGGATWSVGGTGNYAGSWDGAALNGTQTAVIGNVSTAGHYMTIDATGATGVGAIEFNWERFTNTTSNLLVQWTTDALNGSETWTTAETVSGFAGSAGGGWTKTVTTINQTGDVKVRLLLETGTGGASFDDFVVNDFVAVPEPSSTALLGLGGIALILRRRK